MKKTVLLHEETHTKLGVLRAENRLKSFDEAVNFLMNEYKNNKKSKEKK